MFRVLTRNQDGRISISTFSYRSWAESFIRLMESRGLMHTSSLRSPFNSSGRQRRRTATLVDSVKGCIGERSLGSLIAGHGIRGVRRAPLSLCGCAIERGERLCAIAHLEAAWLWRWRFWFWFIVCETVTAFSPVAIASDRDDGSCREMVLRQVGSP